MKINFSAELKTIDGETIKESDKPGAAPAKIARFCVDALMATYKDEAELSGSEKLARFELATRVVNGGEVELTADEAAKIKELVGKAYGPLIVGQIWPLLDGK